MTATALRLRLIRDAGAWKPRLGVLALVIAVLLCLFARDVAAMVGIWWSSSTFNHVLLIPPLIGWLVALRRGELARLEPAAWAPGLAIVAVGSVGWLLGAAASVDLARQLGLIVMLQGAVVSLLGPAVARSLLFPLAYAFFLVPFGEELVPPLQTLTARMCMALLDLAGVPARIDGVFITIPNGWFEVAEACSGVKFLIAMIAYGALVANVCFKSWPRRIAFMAAAVVIPIVANGLRAFGTIWIAHLSSSDFASGIDHVFYGWIFFGIVIALTVAAGWPFFDRRVNDPWIDVARLKRLRFRSARAGPVAAAIVALALLPLLWSGVGAVPALPRGEAPAVPGWSLTAVTHASAWHPRFVGADKVSTMRYRDPAGATVDLVIAVYARQGDGRELIGFGQGIDDRWAWAADAAPVAHGRADRIIAAGPAVREVVTFYRIGDTLTGSAAEAKLATLKARLIGGPQRAVAVLVSAEGGGARPAIDRFLSALGPVETLADRAAGTD